MTTLSGRNNGSHTALRYFVPTIADAKKLATAAKEADYHVRYMIHSDCIEVATGISGGEFFQFFSMFK